MELSEKIELIDLQREYSRELLIKFFDQLLKPNFGVRRYALVAKERSVTMLKGI